MSMMNKVKALGARVVMDDEDIRARLKKDHDRFKELTRSMCETKAGNRRRSLLAELKATLVPHARAEERTAYDALIEARNDSDAHTLAREGYVEHGIVDELLAKMPTLDAASEEWAAHAKVLRELLTEHIEEEETDTFAELGANFSDEELNSMGARFAREKAAVASDESRKQQTRGGMRAASQPVRSRRNGSASRGAAASRSARAATRRTPPRKAAKRGTARGGRSTARSTATRASASKSRGAAATRRRSRQG